MPLTTAAPGHQIRKGGKQLFVFDLNVLDDSTRKVFGLATGPQLDRENETILKAAIEDALPNFMMLPIMHLDHTERPVGWFTKAEFRGQDLYVEACVKPTSDCDEFWGKVVKASQAGKPYQFSIYGDRVHSTPSCALHPSERKEPCITKALELYSISICQPGTAINPNTFAEVIKAMIPQGLVKATDSASNLIHPTTDGKYPKKGSTMVPPDKEKNPEKKPQPPMEDTSDGPDMGKPKPETGEPEMDSATGGESDGGTKAVIELLTQVVQRLQSLESSLGLYKAKPEVGMTESVPSKKKEDEEELSTAKCTKKADVPVPEDPNAIIKANLDRITKAEERLTAVEEKVNLIMKAIPKQPDVIVLDPKLNAEMAKEDKTAPVQKSAASANLGKLAKMLG